MRLYVGNLPFSYSEEDLKKLFSAFASLLGVKLIIDYATGRSKGFGFVDITDDEEAQRAIKELNGKVVDGKTLTVNEARPQEKKENNRPAYNKPRQNRRY